MTKEEIIKRIENKMRGQGNQIDTGSVLPDVLHGMMQIANMPYARCHKVEPYLYETDYNNIDYDYAKEYFNGKFEIVKNACTAVRNGEYIGRNLDMLYDNSVSLVVRVAPSDNRYASVGMVSGLSTLTKQVMESGEYADALKIAPFYVMDGINEKGLFCEVNLLNREDSKGTTTGTTPEREQRERINMLMLTRYIIDHYASVDEAVNGIRDYVSVYAPQSIELPYEYHYMLADVTKTVIMEFVGNALYVREVGEDKDFPAINVNFYAHNVFPFMQTKDILRNISADPDAHNTNGVSTYGMGIERYNIANDGLADANTAEGMRLLMRNLFYTKAYSLTQNKWYTEFVGGNLTVTSANGKFSEKMQRATEAYNNRERNNPQTWQTIHSAVYDIVNGTILVCVQESDTYHEFAYFANDNGVIGDLADLETDHKSSIVEAINEIFDVIETPEMVVSMMQSTAERQIIYNECKMRPHIAKNIVFYNISDAMYYRVNGYNVVNNILYLHTIMADGTSVRSITVQIGANGSIAIAQ